MTEQEAELKEIQFSLPAQELKKLDEISEKTGMSLRGLMHVFIPLGIATNSLEAIQHKHLMIRREERDKPVKLFGGWFFSNPFTRYKRMAMYVSENVIEDYDKISRERNISYEAITTSFIRFGIKIAEADLDPEAIIWCNKDGELRKLVIFNSINKN